MIHPNPVNADAWRSSCIVHVLYANIIVLIFPIKRMHNMLAYLLVGCVRNEQRSMHFATDVENRQRHCRQARER